MRLKYLGTPGEFIDFESRCSWAPGSEREVTADEFNRLIGTGLFKVSNEPRSEKPDDGLESLNKMNSPKGRK